MIIWLDQNIFFKATSFLTLKRKNLWTFVCVYVSKTGKYFTPRDLAILKKPV